MSTFFLIFYSLSTYYLSECYVLCRTANTLNFSNGKCLLSFAFGIFLLEIRSSRGNFDK